MASVTVQEFVKSVLASIPKPYGADIIDLVYQAIENNPQWLDDYNQLVGFFGKYEVENSIGFNVMGLTGMKSLDRKQTSKSGLIENFIELG